ncbi:molybdopterin-guanine dinucleotide biosynthesis protein A [Longilinea arvoryzae]|uniref:Molybdopterin-guanine dinucleotide biosynthesis protein A n=2 Tax=Longilinea arvoryzae TaxID=360412 RepID=A0A0S7BK21_9CHLR|nr:molybdopterin-guanine dinucleotide biosynthesis protein A [Longilinea arvoryzae]
MGRNKALVSFLGRPLVQHVIERLRPLADEVLITTNQPAGLESLSVPLVADVFPGQGALGGLYTAVWAAKYPVVAVVACDMPFASLDLLQFQIDVLVQQNQDVVIPGSEEGWEPLHCVYRKPTCLPQIKAALVQGQKRLISWFPNVNVRYLQGNEVRRYDPLGIAFRNINTPEELQQAEVLARKLA